ncbi:condensin-2 complex subunit D3 [Centropristis striata]|uniref:condensin-2 complex subunit D3 n=1 Tax=Centropristis striata TaxID=184440 RepID=UPI0027E1AB1D|nr:condensin-2 complex subunit D3 [Centropristis striata]
MDLMRSLQFLKLNHIPQDWVEDVWDAEFTEGKPLDDSIQDELTVGADKAFRSLFQCLWVHASDQQQSATTDDVSQSIWIILGKNEVSIKSLVATLSFFVLAGKAKTATVQQRVLGLNAASVYLLLLGIPGSIAHKVFHEVLLDTCLDLTCHCWPQDSGKKRKKGGLKASQAGGKRAKPKRKDAPEMEVDEDEEEDELNFSGQDLMKIRDAVVLLVQSLLRLLQTFPLKHRPETASNCTQIFIKLLYTEPVIGEIRFAVEQDITALKSVPEMAFYGMQLLLSPKHGDQKEALRSIFHRLLYVILMMNEGDGSNPSLLVPSQTILSTRNQAIQFVCHIVDELKELGLPFLQILLQHICIKMVENSEFRSHGAQAVAMLTSHMASPDYACFIKWLYDYSRHKKMVCRLFSVDVVMVLLEQTERSSDECQDPELSCFLPHKFLIQNLLFARRKDISPTVQGHAFNCLAQCLELPSLNVTRAVHTLFSGTQTVLEAEITEGCSQQTGTTYHALPFRTVEISTTDGSNCEAKENLALLLQRVSDSSINVRKAALQAMVGLLKHNVIPMSWEILDKVSERSRDPALSVKKKALQCVGELLTAAPECSVVQKAWLHGVLPAVMDSDVQEKALEALDLVLLSQVKHYSASRHLDASQRLTWDLVGQLCHDCKNLSRYFSMAFTIWSRRNKLTQELMTNLISHTEADHSAGAWLMLSKVVASSPGLPYGKILDAWEGMFSSKDVSVSTRCHILSVMGDIAAHLNEFTKDRIVDDLMSRLKTFTLSLEEISAALQALYQYGCSENVKQTQGFLNRHCGELVSVCEAYLAGILLKEQGTQNLNVELMVKHIHTLGVASLHCPAKVGKRTVLLVESLLTDSVKLAENQEELPASLPLSQFKANCLPTKVRAHGVLALGKLCLQHEDLAHKYLPVFARELEVGTEVAVRNNVIVIMTDLCVRYTNLAEHYIPNMSSCLRDNEAIVREQTLIMLTKLLQEDFVKWRGSLFFRFMIALVDPVPAIASVCEYCLFHRLLKSNPEMFSKHFIECIFHFNSYDKHKSYNQFPQSDRDKVRFSLKGAQHRENRFRIYRLMLEHFTDAHRFNITIKINQNILECFADKELPLDADGAEILSETFSILSLKEMKLQAISAPTGGAAGEELENRATMAQAVMQATQKKLASQVRKKAFIENTVPIIISLKNLLEQKRSPVLRDLMTYLQLTMQDYRDEVKDFFSKDEQLALEVEYLLKTAEREKQMEEEMEREMEERMKTFSLTGDTRTPTAQRSVQGTPARSPVGHQLPHPNVSSNRLSHTDRSVHRSRQEEHVPSQPLALEESVAPRRAVGNRVISTPKDVSIFMSFHEDISRIVGDQDSSVDGESSLLHMRPVEQQTPGRQWNVESPLRQKKRSKQ